MTGLELAKAYYETYGKRMLAEEFPRYVDRIAVGLAGEGSECFGFDDAISRDHDFGPSFCMWLFMAIRRARKNRLAASAWACYASMIFIAGRSDVRMPNSV